MAKKSAKADTPRNITAQLMAVLQRATDPNEGGWSVNATEVGVSHSALQKLLSGTQEAMRSDNVDRLCRWFAMRSTATRISRRDG